MLAINPSLRSLLNPTCQETVDRLKELAHFSFFSDDVLTKNLSEILAQDLTPVLKCLFKEALDEDLDPITIFERLSPYISIEKLEETIRLTQPQFKALQETQARFIEAKTYFDASQGFSPTISSYFHNTLNAIVNIIESILNVFGIAQVLKPSEGEIHAGFKAQRLMMLFQLLMILCTVLLPLLGHDLGGIIIGATFGGIVVLSLIFPHIRPMPDSLPANAEPITKQIRDGNRGIKAKKESLDQIASCLGRNQHALLVGPSRVGKTLTAKAFAEAIERGDYPEFEGFAVFKINTADIVGHGPSFMGGGNDTLFKIHEAEGRHAGKIILIFDEIHMACKDATMADQFKPFLDEGGKFPWVIGITTDEESQHVRENKAFGNRFEEIKVTSTAKDETIGVLSAGILSHPAKPIVEPDALDEMCKGGLQPVSGLKVLKKCIEKVKTFASPTAIEIEQLEREIEAIQLQAAALRGKLPVQDLTAKEERLAKLKMALDQERASLQRLKLAKRVYDVATEKCYKAALAQDQHKFVLFKKFFDPICLQYINTAAAALKVQAVIDTSLVKKCASAA